MGLLIANIAINAFVCFSMVEPYGMGWAGVAAVFWLLQVLGALLLGGENTRGAGNALVFIGSIAFLPLSYMAIHGSRTVVRDAEMREAVGY